MRRNMTLILHIGSWVSKKSPLCRCQRHGWTPKHYVSRAALIMTRTHLKSRLLNFKETLKRGTRHITSIEIWSSDLELRYPLNLLNLTEYNIYKNIIRCRIELHGTAPICDCRWKLFKTATTSAVAPCHRHSVLANGESRGSPGRRGRLGRLGARRDPLKWHPSSGYARVNQGKPDDFWETMNLES